MTSPLILEAFKRYDEGMTMKEIEIWLNQQGLKSRQGRAMSYYSVEHMLKNRRYIGEIRFRDVVIPDAIPAIVPKDLFDRVQAQMEKNKKAPARHKAEDDYLLTTKLFCGHCGAYLFGECGTSHTQKLYHYYKCVNTKKRRTCTKKPVKKKWIEDLVVNLTMKMVMDDGVIDAITAMVMSMQDQENTTLPLLEQQLRVTETGIENMLNAIQQGILTKATKGRLDALEAAKEELEARIACEKLAKPRVSEEFVRFWLHKFRRLDATQQSHRKMLIDTFINAIYLYDDKMVMTFNYKDGEKTISLAEVETALAEWEKGSDMECSGEPVLRTVMCGVFCYNETEITKKNVKSARLFFET